MFFSLCMCPVFFWRVFLSCSSVLVLSHQQVIRPWRKNIVGRRNMLSLLFLNSQAVRIVGGGKWHIEFAISLQSNCTHCGWKHNVFWICYFSSVKLYPNTTFGALKMLVNASTSTFGLVCSDGFGPEEATVACRDLGYPYGLQMCCSAFGYINSPPIRRTNLQCTGREQALRDCTYSISMDYCPSRKYASVICSSLSPNTGESQCLLCDKHFHWQASPLKCLWICLGCVCTSNGGKGGNHLTVLCDITAHAATTRICYASFTLLHSSVSMRIFQFPFFSVHLGRKVVFICNSSHHVVIWCWNRCQTECFQTSTVEILCAGWTVFVI